ncbi:DUF3237 domain-containing protein [Paraburkholderia sp. CNPSo 3274]|uniref:DUF3237 domain-containing protein n=1 Tax=Paraburkholderia sp. CNPSo 3274 TaxID=2940932 RepID=UPI0020B6C3FE|nr:DUF3237 domain-containing protein [Paraburkholderia sp. CNPSo 3274]MCP3713707.1 DUF3237 domain-containing protein [Paraburkholderia sp. CNPSo 3274]
MSASHTPQFDDLPPVMKEVRTRPLFVVRLGVKPIVTVGQTPDALRRVGIVESGTFQGDRLTGTVLDGSNDWQTVRGDTGTTHDVRLTLRTDDGVNLLMSYHGVRYGPTDVIQRLEQGEVVDPASYYFRINPIFEAPAGRYEWLNGILAVGVGHRFAYGPVYSVFEVL